MTTRPHNKNLNTPYSTYINKMPTSTADWTWTKARMILVELQME
ncbi:hypothetical protein NXV22_04960 [Bacteroides thetaiotaomicron]|nr:hypothetical protein [Bacteroides thetaiotaomicron]